jgi:propionyl-CoA carboxylase alpha chain
MGEQAVALARAVDYKSAGTVEFIVDPERNFYFLEMNTRLQVEHPVTELITGLDLVELMIHIAAGEKLNLKQDDIRMNGWAIETRIYAEDPLRNFLPSTGRLTYYVPPPSTTVTSDGNAQTPADPQVRVDAGVIEGGEVSVFYDPMLAKLCTWGTTRDEATRRMREALDEYYIRGVSHNILFLSSLMANRRFIEGRLSTNFIAEEYPNGFQADGLTPILIAAATVIHRRQHEREMQISGKLPENKIALRADWVVVANGQQHRVRINPLDGSAVGIAYTIDIEGKQVDVRGNWQPGEPLFRATIDGEIVCVQVDRAGIGYRLFHGGAQAEVRVLTPHAARLLGWMPEITPPDMSKFVLSPMPGLLVSLAVQIGQPVKAGDTVAVIEAMKMANTIRAGQDGVVHKLHATPGTSIAVDQKIVEFA